MDEIVYKIDNWSIIKLLGGLSAVLIAIIGFVFYLIQNRLLDKWKSKDQKEIEELKGLIERNNSIFTTLLSKTQPDQVVEKRLKAIETLWGFIIETKNKPPATVRLALSILVESEFTMASLTKFSEGQLEQIQLEELMMKKPLISDYEGLRYLVPPRLWTMIFIYQATVNRTCYLTVNGFQTGKPIFWLADNGIKTMLATILDEREINYLYKLEIQAYDILLDFLEHKILTETNRILSGETQTEDNLKVIQRIKDLLKRG